MMFSSLLYFEFQKNIFDISDDENWSSGCFSSVDYSCPGRYVILNLCTDL